MTMSEASHLSRSRISAARPSPSVRAYERKTPGIRGSIASLACRIASRSSRLPSGHLRSPPDEAQAVPLSADQFGFGNPGALLALQLERLHGGLLLEGDGEFAFDALAVDGAGVVGAEGVNLAVGGGIVDHAALDSFHVVIIGIHEVHAGQHQGSVSETLGLILDRKS